MIKQAMNIGAWIRTTRNWHAQLSDDDATARSELCDWLVEPPAWWQDLPRWRDLHDGGACIWGAAPASQWIETRGARQDFGD